jgi:hypothetical protein
LVPEVDALLSVIEQLEGAAAELLGEGSRALDKLHQGLVRDVFNRVWPQ